MAIMGIHGFNAYKLIMIMFAMVLDGFGGALNFMTVSHPGCVTGGYEAVKYDVGWLESGP